MRARARPFGVESLFSVGMRYRCQRVQLGPRDAVHHHLRRRAVEALGPRIPDVRYGAQVLGRVQNAKGEPSRIGAPPDQQVEIQREACGRRPTAYTGRGGGTQTDGGSVGQGE